MKLVSTVDRDYVTFLDELVTMDETIVSLNTRESKKMSEQWVKKGQPGPIKARVYTSLNKIMVLEIFHSKGLIYSNFVQRDT